MSDYYDDDDGVYRMRYRQGSPVRYVEPRASYLVPERRPRSRSQERFRGQRAQSPSVLINNSVYNELSDDEEGGPVRLAVAARRRAPSRSRPGPLMTREEMEFEQTMNELRKLRLEAQKRKEAEEAEQKKKVDEAQRSLEEYHDLKRNATKQKQAEAERDMREMMALREEDKKRKKAQDEKDRKELEDLMAFRKEAKKKQEAAEAKEREDLKEAKRQLDEIKKKEAQEAEEGRLRRELEFKRMKQSEMEAAAKEEREKEIERRFQKQLIEAGLPENQIAAILKGERAPTDVMVVQHPHQVPNQVSMPLSSPRPMYTRVARRHVSFETLRTFDLDYDLDPADPDYILIKSWVPEEEQDSLWKHTRYIREKRRVLMIEDRKHHRHRHDPEFEWVRRSGSSRRVRSKSPSLLMYLAGAR